MLDVWEEFPNYFFGTVITNVKAVKRTSVKASEVEEFCEANPYVQFP